jgi:four helix bundle protein
MSKIITTHFEWQVFQKSADAAMKLFRHSKTFPKEETYSLTDQVRRSSRSVSANLSEAWRKRRYRAAFLAKLSDAEAEAAETQTWIAFAVKCEYLPREEAIPLHQEYDEILRMIVSIIAKPEPWLILLP